MAERNQTLDMARGSAILFVVFGHAIQSANAMSPHDPLLNVIMTFWMPLFFLISGYASGYGSYHGFWKGLRGNLLRLGLPYLIWVEIVYLIPVVFQGSEMSMSGNCHALLQSGFWFLRLLLEVKLMFLTYQAVLRLFRGKVVSEVVAVISSVAVGMLLTLLGQGSIFHFAPLFALGYLAHRCRDMVTPRRMKVGAVACITCFCFGILIMNVAGNHPIICEITDKMMAIVGSVTVIAVTGGLSGNGTVGRALTILGKWSLAIYAVHWCLLFNPDVLHLRTYVSTGWNLYAVGVVGGCVWLVLTAVFIMLASRIGGISMAMFGQRFSTQIVRGRSGS